ncbi:MAG: 30S ribosomal protein S8 [Parcubacteria group bacterium RIFOXYD2_FULL_52_8]|nr:ribosomal protein S8 [uncultured bacterium]OHB24354.1 MAG: 30S ribosomal protein S8 [Parcubacteria group bacterium RIFOXYD2_FULL_52_8]
MIATDPIANMLVALKNAGMVKKEHTLVPASKLKFAIAELLLKHGYLSNIQKKGKKAQKFMELTLAYAEGEPRITEVKRVSKPSRRVYKGAKEIVSVRQGYGIAVYSTPQGLMTDREARKAKVGGELLFTLW